MTPMTPAERYGTRFQRVVMACGFGLIVATAPAAAQQHAPERPADRVAPDRGTPDRGVIVRQITLLVEDMDRSLDFYLRLGLSKASDRTSAEGDQDAVFSAGDLPLAADPKSARVVILKGSSDQAGLIGLVAYDKPRLSSARGSLGGLGTGDVIISVEVPDIQDAYRRLAQIGTRFQRTPYHYTLANGDGTRQAVMRMLAFDPDGHLAEIVQADTGHR